jgi:pimeloyl-ACP methyl ester carboxylesterase
MRKPHDSLCANRGCKRLILVAVATPYARPHRNFFILGFLSSYARISVEIVRVCANFMSLCANRGRNRLILVGATPYARPHRAVAELRKKNRTSFFKSMQNTCLFRLHGAGKTSPQSIARHDDCTSPGAPGEMVGNGIADVMVPAEHSFAIARKAPTAKLLLYPDSGHAFLFQYAEDFCAEVLRFTANLGPGSA